MLGTKQMGFDMSGMSVDYVVQHKKKNKAHWEDLQWINTLDRERILNELKKWRERCPQDDFRAIRRQESDFECEETFNKIVLDHQEFVVTMKRAIDAYQGLTKL